MGRRKGESCYCLPPPPCLSFMAPPISRLLFPFLEHCSHQGCNQRDFEPGRTSLESSIKRAALPPREREKEGLDLKWLRLLRPPVPLPTPGTNNWKIPTDRRSRK